MAADDLATQGAKVSTTMVLTYFSHDILGELDQYYGCWWHGYLCYQVISKHGFDYVQLTGPCCPQGKVHLLLPRVETWLKLLIYFYLSLTEFTKTRVKSIQSRKESKNGYGWYCYQCMLPIWDFSPIPLSLWSLSIWSSMWHSDVISGDQLYCDGEYTRQLYAERHYLKSYPWKLNEILCFMSLIYQIWLSLDRDCLRWRVNVWHMLMTWKHRNKLQGNWNQNNITWRKHI